MKKPLSIVITGLFLGACSSVSATDIGEETKSQCRAIPGVDKVNELEVVQACKTWIKAEPNNGDPYYYHGRTMLDAGAVDVALELFDEGFRKDSRLAENAYWFAQEGSLYGGINVLSGKTLDHFRDLAESGDTVGEVIMGYQVGHEQSGRLTPEDREKMLNFFKSASDSGEPIATFLLGSSQVNDEDPENDGAGIRLLRIAADEGVGVAYEELERLGEIDEVPVDYFNTRYRSGAPVDLIMRRP